MTPTHSWIRAEASKTLRLAAPVMITQLGMMAMGLVDTVLVGPLGSAALAAVSVGNAFFFAVLIFFMGVILALDPLVSQAVGAERHGRAGQLLWQGLWLGLMFGIPLNLVFLDVTWVFAGLRQPAEVTVMAGQYLGTRSFALVPFLFFAAFRSLLNGVGNTKPVMVITLAANVVNAAVDLLLIHGAWEIPALGVAGAGWATSISRWFMLGCILWVVARPRYRVFDVGYHRPESRDLLRVLRLGLPLGSQLFAEVAVFGAAAIMAGWLGAQAQAAHQIAISLAGLTFMMPLGLSIAASIRVGHEIGRGDPDAAARAGRVSLALGGGIMALCGLAFVVLRAPLVRLFSPEPAVFEIATSLLLIAALFQISDGLQVTAQGCLRGGGDTRTPLIINVGVHWLVGLPVGWTLAFVGGYGLFGLWWGLTASLVLAAIILTAAFLRGRWRSIGKLVD